MKNILVIEDESIVSKDIQLSLKKLGYNVCGSASTGEDAVGMAVSEEPDLILMDIMLKGKLNGIETAHMIREKVDVPIIYLTAYADESTLNKAKITEPYGYIIKPFQEIDLHTSIEMALYKHSKEKEKKQEVDKLISVLDSDSNGYLFVKHKSKLVKLNTNEIIYIEALKDYVSMYTLKGKYVIHSTMKDINSKMDSASFIRVHRSYIVRMDKISSIEHAYIKLDGIDKQIPIGGNYKDDLYSKIKTV